MSGVVTFTDPEGYQFEASDEGGFFYLVTSHGERGGDGPLVSIEAGDLVHLAHHLMVAAFAAMEADDEAAPP